MRLTGLTGTKVTLTARVSGRTVAAGSARVTAGKATVRLTFTRAGRRLLRGHRSIRLAIAGGGVRATVVLRR